LRWKGVVVVLSIGGEVAVLAEEGGGGEVMVDMAVRSSEVGQAGWIGR
jgi:hypothetical protein